MDTGLRKKKNRGKAAFHLSFSPTAVSEKLRNQYVLSWFSTFFPLQSWSPSFLFFITVSILPFVQTRFVIKQWRKSGEKKAIRRVDVSGDGDRSSRRKKTCCFRITNDCVVLCVFSIFASPDSCLRFPCVFYIWYSTQTTIIDEKISKTQGSQSVHILAKKKKNMQGLLIPRNPKQPWLSGWVSFTRVLEYKQKSKWDTAFLFSCPCVPTSQSASMPACSMYVGTMSTCLSTYLGTLPSIQGCLHAQDRSRA